MPRISDDLLDICVYLYPSGLDADRGLKAGGSGFLVSIPFEHFPDRCRNYAVTNAHVIEGGNTAVRFNTLDGKSHSLDFLKADWILHPSGDDLAICKMPSLDANGYKYKMLKERDHFITNEIIDQLNIGPGDEIFVVGRFINQDGQQLNMPSVRFGSLAQMPPLPISQERQGGSFHQESFIVEARSIGGYSGSPVFVGMNPSFVRPERPGVTSDRLYLLGVNWGYINDWAPVCDDRGEPIDGMRVKSNTGMMGVVPAWKLAELLRHPRVQAYQKEGDQAEASKRTQAGLAGSFSLTKPPVAVPQGSIEYFRIGHE